MSNDADEFPGPEEVNAPPPTPPPGRNLITPEDSQAFNDFLRKIGSDQDFNDEGLQNHFIGQKDVATYDDWTSDLPPTLRGTVTCLPSARTYPRETSVLQRLPFERSLVNNGPLNDSNVPQHVAPTAIMYSHGPVQHQMPNSGLLQTSASEYYQYFPCEHVGRTDVSTSSDSRLLEEAPPKDPSSPCPSLPTNQARQYLSIFEAQQELSYGSDPCFRANQYVAPADEVIAQRIESGLLSRFDRLNSQESADSTRSPSPQIDEPESPVSSLSMVPRDTAVEFPVATIVRKCPPPKRKISTVDEPADTPQVTCPALQPKEMRSPKPKSTGRQATTAQKEPRVLQSEEENRKKHNEGEQKRRNRATDAWNAFAEIVPGLNDRRSKIADVMYAQRWFQRVLDENERMEKHLHALVADKSSVHREGH
ncbi:MAG: hypothetical protein Q9177_003424 [Variospora cf. flavescens]